MHTGSPAGRTAVVEERTGQSGPAAEAPQTGDGLSQGQPDGTGRASRVYLGVG